MTELTQGASAGSGGVVTTASITPTASAQVFVGMTISKPGGDTTDAGDAVAVSGCNLTWVQVGRIATWSSRRATYVWRGVGASPTTGALTITVTPSAGTALEQVKYSVDQFTGLDAAGPTGTVYTQESSAATSVSVAVGATPSAGDWVYFVGGTDVNEATTLGSEPETKLSDIGDATGARHFTVAYDSTPDSNPAPSMAGHPRMSARGWRSFSLKTDSTAGNVETVTHREPMAGSGAGAKSEMRSGFGAAPFNGNKKRATPSFLSREPQLNGFRLITTLKPEKTRAYQHNLIE